MKETKKPLATQQVIEAISIDYDRLAENIINLTDANVPQEERIQSVQELAETAAKIGTYLERLLEIRNQALALNLHKKN